MLTQSAIHSPPIYTLTATAKASLGGGTWPPRDEILGLLCSGSAEGILGHNVAFKTRKDSVAGTTVPLVFNIKLPDGQWARFDNLLGYRRLMAVGDGPTAVTAGVDGRCWHAGDSMTSESVRVCYDSSGVPSAPISNLGTCDDICQMLADVLATGQSPRINHLLPATTSALKALDARRSEDVGQWARRLAEDVANADD